MTFRRRSRIAALVLLLLAFSGGAGAAPEEQVAFNTESRKFHCLECRYVEQCTANCITIPRSEALRRGGVPCKVCGGSCESERRTAVVRLGHPLSLN